MYTLKNLKFSVFVPYGYGHDTNKEKKVRKIAENDPNYCPYCMRCRGLVRMKKVEDFFWKCDCGAIHDERNNLKEAKDQK